MPTEARADCIQLQPGRAKEPLPRLDLDARSTRERRGIEIMKWTAALVLVGLLGAVLPAQADEAAPVVTVDTGALSGTRNGAIEIFKGIPYASAPTGALRW